MRSYNNLFKLHLLKYKFAARKMWRVLVVTVVISLVGAVITLADGPTQLVSVNRDGTNSGNSASFDPVLSADGRFVAFSSVASDLVSNDTNGLHDVFVRDLQTGTTTLVSANSAGTNSGNSGSRAPVLSADGRFVAFTCLASDLVSNDTNGTNDVFVRDLQTGTTSLVSVNSAGTNSGNSASGAPVLSADGRFVAFNSGASDLVSNDTNGTLDVFVRDLQTGTTRLVSANSAGTNNGNGLSFNPVLSPDGRFVAFGSEASNLASNDTNGLHDVFVRDLQTGTTSLVSANSAGTNSGNSSSFDPVLSADGRFVAFRSVASDLVSNDTNSNQDVFVRDLQTGTTRLVSANSAGTNSGNGFSFDLVLSADGRFVAFSSEASDLVSNDTNGTNDVFVRDLQTGTTRLVSANSAGTNNGNGFSFDPVLSPDGRFVAFSSLASDLVSNDTSSNQDVFVRDLQTGTTRLVSANSAGTNSGNSASFSPVLSADGRFAAFISVASDLVSNDTNGTQDIFVRGLNQPPVVDTTPPVLTLPTPAPLEATGSTGAVQTFTATATDDTDPAPSVSCTPPSGSTFPLGFTIVTCTATDASGNSSNGQFIVIVVDTTPPVLTVPGDLIIECNTPGGASGVVLGVATAADLVDPSPIVTNNAPPTFPLGPTPVVWTATDFSGNSALADQTVTVVDTTPPTITPPPAIEVIANTAGGYTGAIGMAMAFDICDSSPAITNDAPSVFPLGETIVTWTATDARANSSVSATQIVRVRPIPIAIGGGSHNVNLKSKGVIPLAILTTETFDATTIDPLSIHFGPAGATEAHNQGHLEDVDGDGDQDLVLHFETQATGIQCGDTSATLTGQTLSGLAIEGIVSINTVCK